MQHSCLIMGLIKRYDVIMSPQRCSDSNPAGKGESSNREKVK